MSDCRNGGRNVYVPPRDMPRQDVRAYDQREPVRGRILWSDGTETRLTYSRFTGDEKRAAVLVELDGVAYRPGRECTLVKTYAGYPCHDWTCSACGKISNSLKAGEFCPRCGALVTRVVGGATGECPRDAEREAENMNEQARG